MRAMSVEDSAESVFSKLENYLVLKKYRNIDINRTSGVISAMKKKSFLHKSHYLWLVVRPVNEKLTNIELTLNPQKGKRTQSDEIRELKLRSKIFFYL